MYVSDYVIFSDNRDGDSVLIHTYIGNIDILEKKYAKILLECRNKNKEVNSESLPRDIYNSLIKKSYIVEDKKKDKEKYIRAANAIKQISNKKKITYTIIPSYKCNFRCSYCFELDSIVKCTNNKLMSRKIVDLIFRNIDKEKRDVSILLFGGEPLLRENKEINDYIIKKAAERRLEVSAISNGYELDSYIDIFEKGNFKEIQITLDGDEKIHDSRRYTVEKGPTFRKIVENIDKVLKLENGPMITVRINIDRDNYGDVEKLYKLFKDRQWNNNKKFNFYTKSVHACYIKGKEKIFDSDVVKKVKLSENILENMKFNIQYRKMINDIKALFSCNNKLGNLRTSTCGAVNGMKVIDAYGDIYACYEEVNSKESRIGYINLESGEFIYNDNKIKWLDRQVQNLEQCSKCSYSLICGGNCPKHAKVLTGDLYKSCCEDKKEIFSEVLLEIAPSINED